MMVPNSPGGGYDLTARTAVKIMEDDDITGRVEVFNVIGAGGTVAMARLMNEKGNNDLMMTMGLGVVGATYTNGSKIKASDATAIAKLIEDPGAFFVPADSPFKTIGDFVKAWKADPSKITIGGGSSPGGPDHLFPMETARAVGVDPKAVNFVTYDGGGDLLTALLGKKIAAGTSSPGELTDQIEAGQLRVLAVSSEERVEGIDAPTLKEAGIDLTFANWRGVLAPPGISDDAKAGDGQGARGVAWHTRVEGGAGEERLDRCVRDRCTVRTVPEGPGQARLHDAHRVGAAMTTTEEPQENTVERTVDKAQYLVCVVLVLVGAFLIYDAVTLEAAFAKVDPVGPKMFPIVIGVILFVLAAILAVAIPRGSVGEADAGEDVDPNMPSDWRTVGMLVALFVGLILLVNPLGWVITSTLFFAGSATVLGSKHYVRNVAIGLVLALISFYAFYSGLGIPLPAGILDGIL